MKWRERLFVTYYLGKANGNGTEAARWAGIPAPTEGAYRLLRKAHIRAAIAAKLDQIAMPEEEVLARLSDRAASSGEDFITLRSRTDPSALPHLDITKAARRGKLGSIKKIKTTRTPGDYPMEITEVEVYDALPALKILAQFHGLLGKDEHSGKTTDQLMAELEAIKRASGRSAEAPAEGGISE